MFCRLSRSGGGLGGAKEEKDLLLLKKMMLAKCPDLAIVVRMAMRDSSKRDREKVVNGQG